MAAAPLVRKLRLAAGLTLLTYVTAHLINHALGLISYRVMETGLAWTLVVVRSAPGTLALYGAFLVHLALGLWALYRRRTLRMPAWEATQMLFGLAIPPLLLYHVVGTRVTDGLLGTTPSYARVLLFLWVVEPWAGLRQMLMLVLVWIHGCMGVHFWLRFQPAYARVAQALFGVALLVPVLALLGSVAGAREAAALAGVTPEFTAGLMRTPQPLTDDDRAAPGRALRAFLATYALALAGVLAARGVRAWRRRRAGTIRVSYPDRREVVVPRGWSVLEASRFARVPHASVCGARGRCSTCRVRILGDVRHLTPASADERRVLERVGAPLNVRLACQLRPGHDISVVPLLPATLAPADTALQVGARHGREREIAVLFADLRGFTRLAEHKLPYDVVFFLNRYFEAVGSAIADAGGLVNQFTGDGVMALFGVEAGGDTACRQAIVAAGAMVERVRDLGEALGAELDAPLRLGIGVHVGPAVVGGMGYGPAVYLTAVGDTVHVAARLEALTKDYGCELVISEEVAARARVPVDDLAHHDLTLRNRQAPLTVVVVPRARILADRLVVAGGRVGAGT
ncbi:MAG TPA: adenylate/guanylate cyclase domain-containing protein [Methylomirabilota bacterium]|nr:adenylate/guanylate cyclase domain-containing protein [Methylomirabilota bacterium]